MAPIMLSQAIIAQLVANKGTFDDSAFISKASNSDSNSNSNKIPTHIIVVQYLTYGAILCLAIAVVLLLIAFHTKYQERRRLRLRAKTRLANIHGRGGKGWFDPYTVYLYTPTREQVVARRRRLGRDITVSYPTQADVERIAAERQKLADQRGIDIVGRRPRQYDKHGQARPRPSVVLVYPNRTGALFGFRSTRHYGDTRFGNQLKPGRRRRRSTFV